MTKIVPLKQVNKDLDKLIVSYEDLRHRISRWIEGDCIDQAISKLDELLELRKAIKQMESLNVIISYDKEDQSSGIV